jgi:hypothetical protein
LTSIGGGGVPLLSTNAAKGAALEQSNNPINALNTQELKAQGKLRVAQHMLHIG